jgi:hypothetical protein
MGVGKLIEYICVSVIIAWIVSVCTSPRDKRVKVTEVIDGWTVTQEWDRDLYRQCHPLLTLDYRLQPDDPLHTYAVIRAWDRHLKLQGLLPIGTNDLSKVGPILQEPGGEYIVYGYDERGWLSSWRQTLSPSRVQEATRTAER